MPQSRPASRFAARLSLLAALLTACLIALAVAGPSAARADELIHVEVRLAAATTLSDLIAAGLEVELALPDLGRVQGWIDPARLSELHALVGIAGVTTPNYALFAAGSVLSEGDEALGAAAARERFGVDGSGVRVAVISDGILGIELSQERGDAPELVEAVAFGAGRLNRGAEGTAMIELVHDLAPGASLSFGAVTTDADMIAAVRFFAQRVDVIVDDVGFLYPDDQQSEVSRNTAAALANPDWPLRAYVTAAGNWARTHWSGDFTAGADGAQLGLPDPGPVHVWWRGGPINRFELAAGEQVVIALHWDDPWGLASHDFDLHLLDPKGTLVASSRRRQAVDSVDPREVLVYTNEGGGGTFGVVVQNWRGAAPPLRIELFVIGTSDRVRASLEVATAESSLLAQADAGGGVITVAAITQNDANLDRVAEYSSQGPTNNGASKPDIAAVDGVRISVAPEFGTRFYGTSAAAPHVAAVAALVLEAQPMLLAADGGTAAIERELLRELLLGTAVDVGPVGVDLQAGAGRIDAEAAITAARSAVVMVTSAADRGPGTLRAAIDAVNSGAGSMIAFAADLQQREVTLESPLPALRRDGTVLDGAGWRLDARNVAVGLVLTGRDILVAGLEVIGAADAGIIANGERSQLRGVRVAANGRGLVIGGANVVVDDLVAVGNRGPGVVLGSGGSGTIKASSIGSERDGRANGNAGPGVAVDPQSSGLTLGVANAAAHPATVAAPIAPLGLPELEPRSGGVHRVTGVLLVDGLPAPAGSVVELWLDRRSAGAVSVGRGAWFDATIAGPGTAIRFSVGGAPLEQRVDFKPGSASQLLLRAERATPAQAWDEAAGNWIAYNEGPAIAVASGSGAATVRGNLIWSNLGRWVQLEGGSSEAPSNEAPQIREVTFVRGAAIVRGLAPGADSVDLYGATGEAAARYLATVPASEGKFSFERFTVGEVDRFWVVAHDAAAAATGASVGWTAAPTPRIADVTPDIGGFAGGETLIVTGERFRIGSEPPRVFVGGAEALVRSATDSRLEIESPPTNWLGATDIAVLRYDGRATSLRDAYVYDTFRRVTLREGWNSVTWEGRPTRITAALAPIAAHVRLAYVWDEDDQRWRGFSPIVPAQINTLTHLATADVVWVLVEGEDTVMWPQPLGMP